MNAALPVSLALLVVLFAVAHLIDTHTAHRDQRDRENRA